MAAIRSITHQPWGKGRLPGGDGHIAWTHGSCRRPATGPLADSDTGHTADRWAGAQPTISNRSAIGRDSSGAAVASVAGVVAGREDTRSRPRSDAVPEPAGSGRAADLRPWAPRAGRR